MLIADFYTKPLQGKKFRIFRNLILNLREDQTKEFSKSEQKESIRTSKPDTNKTMKGVSKVCTQECVEQNINRTYRDVLCGTKKGNIIPYTGLLNSGIHRKKVHIPKTAENRDRG